VNNERDLKKYLKEIIKPNQKVNPLFRFLGFSIERLSPEKTVMRSLIKNGFLQGAGAVAGGILATIADEAMAHVVLANLNNGQSTATIELNIRYLRPIKSGEIIAIAEIVKKGRNIITATSEVRDGNDSLLACAGASFMVINKK
jgi:uncharacterized protein (TIGR00369 family)